MRTCANIFLAVAVCAHLSVFAQSTTVPFIGCKSDGQLGPMDAPEGKSRVVPIPAEAAKRLAYYESAQGLGVLSPRGWFCFGTYGSGGDALQISPQPIATGILFASDQTGLAGPAIELVRKWGGTSGRFGVAEVISRVFPAHRAFVSYVIHMDPDSNISFPGGPYPTDSLTYKGNEMVEYETPAQTEGLGTNTRLREDASPIRGVAILVGETPDLLRLAVRLPAGLDDLTPTIIQQVERFASKQ